MAADELTLAFQQELKRTRQATADAAKALWNNLSSYNEIDIQRYTAQVEPIIRAGQQRALALTNAYLSNRTGVAPAGITLDHILPDIRNGLPLNAELKRAFQGVWNDLGSDVEWATAVQRGAERISSSVGMDVLLAYAHSNVAFAKSSGAKIYGWSRSAGADCCKYCAEISGEGNRLYKSSLIPLHNNCTCTVEPVMSRIHSNDVLRMNESVGSSMVREHGELGPVITDKNDEFNNLTGIAERRYERSISKAEGENIALQFFYGEKTPAFREPGMAEKMKQLAATEQGRAIIERQINAEMKYGGRDHEWISSVLDKYGIAA